MKWVDGDVFGAVYVRVGAGDKVGERVVDALRARETSPARRGPLMSAAIRCIMKAELPVPRRDSRSLTDWRRPEE